MEIIGFLLNGTLAFATALIFAALGGLIVERSGVISLGLEGFMVSGAFSSAVTAYYAEQAGFGGAAPWLGCLAALVFTLLFSGIHVIASIQFKANQVVSGIVVNMLAASSTFFIVKLLFNGAAETPVLEHAFRRLHFAGVSDIPLVGKAFFQNYPTTYLAFLLVILATFVMYKTPLGLRMRAVGEHPGAADAAGINVNRLRAWSIMVGGSIAALGGATIVLTANSSFGLHTISGQGFTAVAAVIFGRWHPVGAMGAALFFGFAQALKDQVQLYDFAGVIPTEIFYMFPYVLTLIALVMLAGKSNCPAALGQPYELGK